MFKPTNIKHLAAALLLFCGLAHAQSSVVAHTLGQCLASNTALTMGSSCGGSSIVGSAIDTTGASLLIACPMVFGSSLTIGTVTDNKGNSWTALTQYTFDGNYNIQLWYAIPPDSSHIGSGHTFTVASSGSSTFNSMGVVALVGTQASTLFRTGTDAGQKSDNGNTLTVNPVAANDALITCLSDDNSATKTNNGSFTVVDSSTTTANGETGATGFQSAPNTSSITYIWTTNQSGAYNYADFEVGPAPSAPANKTMPPAVY